MARKKYTQEFKDQAVRLVLDGDASVSQASRDLDVDLTTLRRWRKEYCIKHNLPLNDPEKADSLEAENMRLRRECKRLQMERDILKKALSIFSEGQR